MYDPDSLLPDAPTTDTAAPPVSGDVSGGVPAGVPGGAASPSTDTSTVQQQCLDCALAPPQWAEYAAQCTGTCADLAAQAIAEALAVLQCIESGIASCVVPATQSLQQITGQIQGQIGCACNDAQTCLDKCHSKILAYLYGVISQATGFAAQLGIYPRPAEMVASGEMPMPALPSAEQRGSLAQATAAAQLVANQTGLPQVVLVNGIPQFTVQGQPLTVRPGGAVQTQSAPSQLTAQTNTVATIPPTGNAVVDSLASCLQQQLCGNAQVPNPVADVITTSPTTAPTPSPQPQCPGTGLCYDAPFQADDEEGYLVHIPFSEDWRYG